MYLFVLPSADNSLVTNVEKKLKEIEEQCKKKERQRVDLELNIVAVKENLKKAESGPVTLGTAVDTTHLENASPKVHAMLNGGCFQQRGGERLIKAWLWGTEVPYISWRVVTTT